MTFVEGFYGFNISIVDAARNRYEKLRIKIARHPDEPAAYLHARVLAYAAEYEHGLEFSAGLFEPKSPTLLNKDVIGSVRKWVQVGLPDREKIHRALRAHRGASFAVYFLYPPEVERFCHHLRGSTSNWIEPVRFYLLDQNFLAVSAEYLTSSSTWELTFADNSVYLEINGREYETVISQIEIWRRYQASIQNG